jgi:hypothetical protein
MGPLERANPNPVNVSSHKNKCNGTLAPSCSLNEIDMNHFMKSYSLFIYLFVVYFSNSDYIMSNERMTGE